MRTDLKKTSSYPATHCNSECSCLTSLGNNAGNGMHKVWQVVFVFSDSWKPRVLLRATYVYIQRLALLLQLFTETASVHNLTRVGEIFLSSL